MERGRFARQLFLIRITTLVAVYHEALRIIDVFVGGVGVVVTHAYFAFRFVRTSANLPKAQGAHVRWQNAYRRGRRRRISRGSVAHGAVSAVGRPSHRTGPLRRDRQRDLSARRRHGRATTPHPMGYWASGQRATVAAETCPAPTTSHPCLAREGDTGRAYTGRFFRTPFSLCPCSHDG